MSNRSSSSSSSSSLRSSPIPKRFLLKSGSTRRLFRSQRKLDILDDSLRHTRSSSYSRSSAPELMVTNREMRATKRHDVSPVSSEENIEDLSEHKFNLLLCNIRDNYNCIDQITKLSRNDFQKLVGLYLGDPSYLFEFYLNQQGKCTLLEGMKARLDGALAERILIFMLNSKYNTDPVRSSVVEKFANYCFERGLLEAGTFERQLKKYKKLVK